MKTPESPVPVWARWLAVGFLMWNLLGLAAFAMQATLTPDDVARMPADEQTLWRLMPGWLWFAYALGVGAGTAAAIALFLRRRSAVLLYLFSLVGVTAQFAFPLGLWIGGVALPVRVFILPVVILGLAAVQWVVARRWQARGWLV